MHCSLMLFEGFKHDTCSKMHGLGYVIPSVPHAGVNTSLQVLTHGGGGGAHGHGILHCSNSSGLSQLAHINLQESGYVNPSDPHTAVPGSGFGISIVH